MRWVTIVDMQTQGDLKNVLLITDDAPEIKIMSATLKKAGFHVSNVPFANSALHTLLESGETIDVAIIDTPGPQDTELLQQLHDYDPNLRMLFIAPGEPARNIGPAGHVRGYIHKPVRRAQLLGNVLKLIASPSTFAA